jgi:integrase
MGRGPGVRATGANSIQIDFRWEGRRYRERLRLRPTSANLKYAARLKATIEHEIATHTFDYARHFPRSPRARGAPGARISAAMQSYLDTLARQLEPETLKKYLLDAQSVAQGLGDPPLVKLTRAAVRDWVARLQLSKKRIDNLLTPLRGACSQALDDGTLTENPLAGFRVKRIRKVGESIDPFTKQEIAALGKTEFGALWVFWAWSGLRSGEVIGLRWSDVEPDASAISVRRSVRVGREKRPKTGAGVRLVRLLPAARAALASLARPNEGSLALFTSPATGRRWHEDRALARAFRKACKAANVRYRYPYQLRHTFASWALSAGENPLWVAKQMGHRDVSMIFRVYGRYMPDMNPEAGTKMAG